MKLKQKLSDAELDIMQLLWQRGEAVKARDIQKSLSDKRSWTRQTVHVLLSRLEEKGFINADRSGYYHKFSARVDEASYLSSQVKKTGSSLHTLLASLIEADELSDEDIIEISDMLNAKRKEIEKK